MFLNVPDIPLTATRFIQKLKANNRERFDEPEWSFNDRQKEAILAGEGPLHLAAGPGSGKTEVLVSRALKLILVDEVRPGSILLTTFTEKAAQNMEERITDRLAALGYDDAVDANKLRIGTLHSLCNDLMSEYRYEEYANVELLDGDGQQLFMHDSCEFVSYLHGNGKLDPDEWKTLPESHANANDNWEFFENLFGWGVSKEYGPNKWQATEAASSLLNRLSQYRTDVDTLQQEADPHWQVAAEGLKKYRRTLKENRRVDFARLLERFIDFLDSNSGERFVEGEPNRNKPPLRHVLVDEYQDTNPLQEDLYFELLEALDAPNITVVGDDDQALYRFRGGTVECLIRFPNRVKERFDTEVTTIQLNTNYRSTEDIVEWCNRYIGEYPLMNREGARADGKEPMDVGRSGTEDRVGVRAILEGESDRVPADIAAELVDELHDRGYIQDYSQVAYLFKSTKETSNWARDFVEALRDRGIPVHNPRNKAFLKQEEIQLVLGALIHCMDPELEGAEAAFIKGRVRGQLEDWYECYDEFVVENDATALDNYVQSLRSELAATDSRESLNTTPLDLVYRILSFEPFLSWIENPADPARGRRLGRLTNLIDSFTSVHGPTILQRSSRDALSVSTSFLRSFYYLFCGYLEATDFDEPEKPHDQLPSGFVQVMTVHQAKGLEFPIVFTSDLDSEAWTDGTYWIEEELRPYAEISAPGSASERAERDEVRRFYVAYSRAETDLFLLDRRWASTPLSLGWDEAGRELTSEWFDAHDRRVSDADDFLDVADGSVGEHRTVDLKRRYSITGDVLAYRRCKRQYGYFTDMDFTPNHVTQLYFGRVVHETLDRAHRHYAGDLDGVPGGEVPSNDDIERYFKEVSEALKARNIYPMSQDAEKTALEYLQRFNEREGEQLYPRVRDTEHDLQSTHEEFILEGVVDVLISDEQGHEIWDYKAGQRPDSGHELEDYHAQLNTYAELYRYNEGVYPDRGVIYFLGEDDPEHARFELEFDPTTVQDSIDSFEQTVRDIEDDRESRGWFNIGPDDAPSEGTCAECDIRFECPARPNSSD
ncbi:ATP-dependent DNA helicase [Haloarchaeobius sp. TZWSO28]|uniref:ATP-dependent DNA helicase n=1 Tax=Haloarchaeobius sp. TZWSO28 TaxID=3446119 RepID=UPI003EC0300D